MSGQEPGPKDERATIMGYAQIAEVKDPKERLRLQLKILEDQGIDLEGLGFDDNELARAIGENYESTVEELDLSDVLEAEFFVQVRGPLRVQPDVLDRLREALQELDGVSVEIAVT